MYHNIILWLSFSSVYAFRFDANVYVIHVFRLFYSNILFFQNFGWTPQEAKLHMVDDYFSNSEVKYFFCVFVCGSKL